MINHGFRYPLDPLQVIYQVGYLELKMVYITRKMWQKSQSCNSSVSTMWTNVHYFLAVKSKYFRQMQFDEGEGSALRMLSVASRRITQTKSWLLRRKLSNFKYFSSPIQQWSNCLKGLGSLWSFYHLIAKGEKGTRRWEMKRIISCLARCRHGDIHADVKLPTPMVS